MGLLVWCTILPCPMVHHILHNIDLRKMWVQFAKQQPVTGTKMRFRHLSSMKFQIDDVIHVRGNLVVVPHDGPPAHQYLLYALKAISVWSAIILLFPPYFPYFTFQYCIHHFTITYHSFHIGPSMVWSVIYRIHQWVFQYEFVSLVLVHTLH